jgi:Secretion system C-terminal sorting domain
MYKFIIILLLTSLNLFSQEINFNKTSLGYFFNQPYFPEHDSIMIYNNGSDLLEIDSIYSRRGYGYGLNLDSLYSDKFFYVFIGLDSLYIAIEPNDSIELFFSYPDFCPICKKNLDIKAFSDTLVFYSNSISNNYSYIIVEGDGSTDVEEDELLLNDFVLYQNYPNPFNPTTKIDYYVPKTSLVSLKIYDLMGRQIKNLIEEEQIKGNHSVTWDGTNDENRKVTSSIYFYKLETRENRIIRKMVLIK